MLPLKDLRDVQTERGEWSRTNGAGEGVPPPPTNLHETQNKKVSGSAFCKRLKVKGFDDGKIAVYSVDSVARRERSEARRY